MSKAYRFSNGIVLNTEVELTAYTRGLEMSRTLSESCTGGRTEFLSKMSAALEEAHTVKTAGPTEETTAEEEKKSDAA